MDLLERAKILLKATKELLDKQENSFYVKNLLEETVFYDGVDCDGSCLKDDIDYWFDELEDTQSVNAISIPEGATNGDMIRTMFPDELLTSITSTLWWGDNMSFNKDWWNAPYSLKK